MIDTLRQFDSLHQAKEFTVTEDHLKLLRHTYDIYWDPGEGYGAPAINPKKPYGNSAVPQDVATILGAPNSDWEQAPDWDWDEDEFPPPKALRAEAEDRYLRVHVETAIALMIALATGEFRPGRYTRTNAWGNDWKRQQS
jgi:hypothetical protein